MPADGLIADLIDLGGAGLAVTELSDGAAQPPAAPGMIQVGVHRGGPVPGGGLDAFDILLSSDPAAPGPWVGVESRWLGTRIAELGKRVAAQPVAAAVCAQVLRMTLALPFDQALALESLSYSMLLGSAGFRAWRAANPPRSRSDDGRPRVLVGQEGRALDIRLNRPAARNAFDARMRDELSEALAFAAAHPDRPPVTLSGQGPAFSAGGDLDEFGQAEDPGQAHLIRTLRSPVRLAHELGPRLTARLHGACVGAGIEVPAAAARVTAGPGSFFRLPEVSMGLIPGAGGTASIPRRIGRRRACYMALSGADIDLATALSWGLVDAVDMSPIAPALDRLCAEVAEVTARVGWTVEAGRLGVLDREGHLRLGPPSHISPNGGCRLVQAADGWIAVNLARDEDRDLVPAWLGCDFGPDPWDLVDAHVREHACADLVASAELLGLPAGAVGEVVRDTMEAPRLRMAAGGARTGSPKVVDMSALWAGPLCGAILAAMGASVTKVESPRRPDPTRAKTPDFFRRVNAGKTELSLDLATPDGQARLRETILAADILITGARPRAFAGLGLDPEALFADHPGLVWAAVTGYGWTGPGANRVAFGDDAAAAGGLVDWTPQGPKFLGDALGDPVTGLAAAAGALRAFEAGGGVLVDVSLAGSAAGAAHVCRLRRAA